MIRSLTVTNHMNESITFELGSPEKSGFLIQSIDGLGPAKATINATEIATYDGSLYNSSRITPRNIVIKALFLWHPTIEDARQMSYRYFPQKKKIHLVITTDNRVCETDGYVESNEPNIFSQSEGTSISIICPDPYLYSIEKTNVVFSGIEPLLEFPFSNDCITIDLGGLDWKINIDSLEERMCTPYAYANSSVTNGVVKQLAADTGTYLVWKVLSSDGKFYFSKNISDVSSGTVSMTFDVPELNGYDKFYFGLNGEKVDTLVVFPFNLTSGTYTISWRILSNVQGSISWDRMQIDYGSKIVTNKLRFTANFEDSGVNPAVWEANSIPMLAKCSSLTVASAGSVYAHETDSSIACENGTCFSVYSSAYTDVPSFKKAMTGVLLEYAAFVLLMGSVKTDTVSTIVYSGDADVGMLFSIHVLGVVTNITIYNVDTRESMKINTPMIQTLTGTALQAGDDIVISTSKGAKSVRLLRGGNYYNILNSLDRSSAWLQLSKGSNTFAYTAESGVDQMEFSIICPTIFSGV